MDFVATQPRRHSPGIAPANGFRGDTAPAIEIVATQPRRLKSRRHSPGD